MELIFQRGTDELTVELRHEIATSEFVVVSRLPDGGTSAERFGGQDEALAYLEFLEARLQTDRWQRAESHRPREESGTPAGNVLKMRPGRMPSPEVPSEAARRDATGSEPPSSAAPDSLDPDLAGTYALERPLFCPHCREWIRSIHVIRLTREHVPFTSTLPRSGRALACSACDGVLSVELSRLI